MGGLEMVRKNPRFAGPLVAGECGSVQGAAGRRQGGARPPRRRPDGLTWWMAVRRLLIPPVTVADPCQPVGQERCQRRLQIIWAGADVCRLFAVNVGSFANNPGPGPPLFAVNPGRKSRCLQVGPRMFAGRYT